jgi:hypothetical protein
MLIEQALYGSRDAAGYRFLARSPGFRDEWLPQAQRLCTDFGERPANVSCTDGLFVQPFIAGYVAIVQVADRGTDEADRPGVLAFRLLIVPAALYDALAGDPFLIADTLPPQWNAEGELTALEWTAGSPPARTTAGLQKVLDVANSAVLLGGVQALLDGGRLVFERREPAGGLVRSLWTLLPTRSRCHLWPATFVFANPARFHVAVVPRATDPALTGYIDEVRAGDYPEGRYELALQIAVESGDQHRLDELLSRRSRSQVMRLGIALLLVFLIGAPLTGVLIPPAKPSVSSGKGGTPEFRLPRAADCPRLDQPEREKLAARIGELGREVGAKISPGASEAEISSALESLDKRLGTPDPLRNPGSLRELGPLQRQVRALLWKHAVADYDAPGANTVELMEKLETKVTTPRLESGPR